MMIIRQIPKEATWDIRQRVMWPDKPLSYVQLKEDEKGTHWGLYDADRLISVVSLFIVGQEAQFRKFATLEQEQGNGYGSKLLTHVLEYARQQGAVRIWCNARTEKSGFYRKFGLSETGPAFDKDGISYVIMQDLGPEHGRN